MVLDVTAACCLPQDCGTVLDQLLCLLKLLLCQGGLFMRKGPKHQSSDPCKAYMELAHFPL